MLIFQGEFVSKPEFSELLLLVSGRVRGFFHNLVIFVKGTLLTFMIILFEPVVRHGPRYISLHLVGFYGKLVGTYTSPIDPIAAKLLPPKLTDGTPQKHDRFLTCSPRNSEDELFNEHIFSDGKINGPTRTSV